MAVNTILEMKDICKSFGPVNVLNNINFTLQKGEIVGLAGANGAGKSTLMKILNGVYSCDAGSISVNGKVGVFNSPRESAKAGIAMVFQDFSLIPTLTVWENLFLAHEPLKRNGLIDKEFCIKKSREIFKRLKMEIDPEIYLEKLPVGKQQIVEIAKALNQSDEGVLILDEPTASLSCTEIESLFTVLRTLKEQGLSIIIVTHHLQEIMDLCDRVSVLRDGRIILDSPVPEITLDHIVEALVGDQIEHADFHSGRSDSDEVVLSVDNLCMEGFWTDLSFQLYKGEILGIAGVLGSGRTELLSSLYGLMKSSKGQIFLEGNPVEPGNPSDAQGLGFFMIPENRHRHGIVMGDSVYNNILIPVWRKLSKRGFLKKDTGRNLVQSLIKRLNIKVYSMDQDIASLSGGNQQKAVLARCLSSDFSVLLLDEPTIGVDIASKNEIASIINDMAHYGHSIIIVSSELDEMAKVCDRVLLLKNGGIASELSYRMGDEISEDSIMRQIQ
ncbi:sugar ABC transporter ATP-binding protein [Oceanispirochaeta sp. M2]|uniref:sugar ABC transporter ATP-binding protein n=1 Tax=Oceanispirochaeta sp. M2 TaxID=2735869 RepID=UPI00155401B6|nr:sugar ABC transporter ATP-binding protein [Oceanispirochaeta sp. M2]MBF9016807.1 sugar ABC transporter ATP-binding protein [Oceanispirochaeta sp. M2]